MKNLGIGLFILMFVTPVVMAGAVGVSAIYSLGDSMSWGYWTFGVILVWVILVSFFVYFMYKSTIGNGIR